MQIDAIEERTGEPCSVLRERVRRAAADTRRIAAETAGARIGRGEEHHACRVRDAPADARQQHPALLERLAQAFEDVAAKLGELVEEENAVVRERQLAGARPRPAAEEAGGGNAVMRRAKRARRHERPIVQ